jgi:hypothetical protein
MQLMSLALCAALILSIQGVTSELSTAQLQRDISYLETKLPEVHLNLSRIVDQSEWHRRCEEAGKDLEKLTGTARLLRMAKLVNSLGVAHTWLQVGNGPFQLMPLRFRWFDDGLTVYATTPELAHLAGARVLSIGGKAQKEIVNRIGGLEPNENVYWRQTRVTSWCGAGDAYFATGLSDNPNQIKFKFKLSNGKTEERTIVASPDVVGVKVVYDSAKLPNFMKRVEPAYQLVRDPESKSLVFDYRRCAPDPKQSMAEFSTEYWKVFDAEGFQNVVVDLRRNEGGNSAVIRPFLDSLRARKNLLDGKRVYALISNQTFSSGMMNAVELKRLGAILMGQPTGGSPNSFGEQKSFELPESKMRVTYCTKYFRLVEDPKQTTVLPDIRVPLNWADIAKGVDACLARIGRAN